MIPADSTSAARPVPPRVLLDLDGTLVDRDGAFARWAEGLVGELCGGREDLEWLLAADAEGYRPRRELAAMIAERFGLASAGGEASADGTGAADGPGGADAIERRLLEESLVGIECYPGVLPALRALRGAGAELVVVTNGPTAMQRAKVERAGLRPYLDRVVISEEAGVAKPDPRIFAIAVNGLACGEETWMLGDHAVNDIGGARGVGLSTAWVSHDREWTEEWSPTLTAPTAAELLERIAGGR